MVKSGMNAGGMPIPHAPPPSAPPSYSQAVGGVPPSSPYVPPQAPGNQMLVMNVVPVGPNATHMTCPHCRAEIFSETRSEPSLIAYISGILIALFGCWCGCCLIPCCIESCMDVHHTCPNCNAYLGRFRRF